MTELKSIWHTADKTPPEDSYIVVKLHSGKCEVGFDFEYDFDNIEKWAFFDDLLALETELERTRKALDVAVDMLTRIAVSPETMMEPEKVVPQLADLALKQITAISENKNGNC